MTRKDYELIAKSIKNMKPSIGGPVLDGYALAVAAVMAAMEDDNPRFDRERFLKACGV